MATRSRPLPLSGDTARRLSNGLAVFSHSLGIAQLAAPGRINALIGVRDDGRNRLLQRVFGMQEITAGTGILAGPRRDVWVWNRVAGDIVHVSLMAASLASSNARDRRRASTTLASLVAITALDAFTAASLTANADDKVQDGSSANRQDQHIVRTTTVNRPLEEVYRYWRNFANLPAFMHHLESVEVKSDTRSRWKAKAPAGKSVEWDAEIVEDQPNHLIAWRSTGDADVRNSGSVRFTPATGNRGTEVRVAIDYTPPAGVLGAAVAVLFGEEPRQQLQEDLLRFKQVMETGEVVLSEGAIHGARLKQHPAQPPGQAVSR